MRAQLDSWTGARSARASPTHIHTSMHNPAKPEAYIPQELPEKPWAPLGGSGAIARRDISRVTIVSICYPKP